MVGIEEMPDAEQRAVNIAFLTGRFPCLSETFILNQITGLIDRGHRVAIFAERGSGDRVAHETVIARGLKPYRVESLPESPLLRLLQLPTVWKWDRYHARALNVLRYGMQSASLRLLWGVHLFDGHRDFDVIQCHFGAVGLKAALLRRAGAIRGALVTAFHGEDIVNYPRRFRGNLYQPLFDEGDLFLPISDRWNAELIAMGCPPRRIRRHRMGIDPGQFPGPGRSERGPSGRPVRILTIGRLVEKKGVEDAIRAIATLSIDWEYVVAGDGPLRPRLQALARTLGIANRIHFQGECTQQQAVSLLDHADLFVAPSVTGSDGDIEGIPVSIMEAMASGLPVVSTLHGAIPELVADNASGYLVAEHDIENLARRIGALAADAGLRERMGRAGRAIVEAEYNIHHLNDRLERYYRELAGS